MVALLAAGCGGARAHGADVLTADEHNDLGVAYFSHGEHALAAREFGRATDLRPGWSRALANLGDAYLAMGRLEEAVTAYEAARRGAPDDPAIANNLAWALLQHATRWPEAEPLIRAALARAPEPRGYYLDTLGVLRLRQGLAAEALQAFRTALRDTAMRDPLALALLLRHAAQALVVLGEPGAAEECEALARRLRLAGAPASLDAVGARNTVCYDSGANTSSPLEKVIP